MLETYSPSGSETELAEHVRLEMASNGFKVRTDHAGNVIGEIGGEGPKVLLCGHMDTVPGRIPVRREGDFLYGRGAVDAKASLAAMLFGAAEARRRSNVPFNVTLACVVEEESSSAGIKTFTAEGGSYDFAVFGEPSGVSNVVIGYKGSLLLEVTVLTNGGHSASPWLSKNSFEEASEFWAFLRESLLRNGSSSKFEAVTGCVTRANIGEASNVIPSKAILEIDIRTPPATRTAELTGKVMNLAKDFESTRSGVRVLVKVNDSTEAFVGMPNSPATHAFRWAIRKTTGHQVSLVKKTGTSDMNLFAGKHSIPMIAYGPGDSKLDHTGHERVSLAEYFSTIEVYACAIPRLASLPQKAPPIPMALP